MFAYITNTSIAVVLTPVIVLSSISIYQNSGRIGISLVKMTKTRLKNSNLCITMVKQDRIPMKAPLFIVELKTFHPKV
jgi:hypothetical protein